MLKDNSHLARNTQVSTSAATIQVRKILGAKFQHYSNSIPKCSMVLEYLPTFTLKKSLNFVGKYTSTMGCIWDCCQSHWSICASLAGEIPMAGNVNSHVDSVSSKWPISAWSCPMNHRPSPKSSI